jgi:DHA1 family tetracycline resistance protein-like MFS transporter
MSVRRNSALSFIFITILIDVIGFGVIIPVLPRLIATLGNEDIPHASKDGSWLLFTFALAQFLFSPILGALSDKFGRRPVLLCSLLGFGLDYIFMAFAPTLGWLFVGRAIAGITGASFTTATAYIADISSPEKRAQNFGMIGAAFGIGFIIGPAMGGMVSHQFGVRAPFILAAVLCFINLAYGYFVLPESLLPEHRRSFQWKRANPIGSLMQLRKYPVVSGLVVSLVLLYIGSHAVQSNWAYFTMFRFGWSEATVGWSLAVVGLLIGLVQGLLIRVVNPKIGAKNAVYVGMALYALGMLLFAFANTSWMMFVFLIPYCLGGIAGPALQGIISGQVPSNEQGELQGALTSLISLTSIVGPLMMNNLFYFFSNAKAPVYFPGAPFIAGAILFVISTLFAARTLKHRYVSADIGHPGAGH